jgi:hypothetical protein
MRREKATTMVLESQPLSVHCSRLDWMVYIISLFISLLLMQLADKLRTTKGSELYRQMKSIHASNDYPPSLHSAMGKAIELLGILGSASPVELEDIHQRAKECSLRELLDIIEML